MSLDEVEMFVLILMVPLFS
uniref:Uncharacterized protein n=1 Tax=Rhizophora mucronata TaxID=61149 RepID=A0A2P2J004_RHIMU